MAERGLLGSSGVSHNGIYPNKTGLIDVRFTFGEGEMLSALYRGGNTGSPYTTSIDVPELFVEYL